MVFLLVSNLSYISKIVERAVVNQVMAHVNEHNLLPVCQSAYRKHHSTETALLKVQSDILQSMDCGDVTLLVLIDLSAAFDTVDHKILLQRLLTEFGISGTPLKWLQSYLDGRRQVITINDAQSPEYLLQHGVPQGSCLGPILFSLYASALTKVIQKHLKNTHGYADDNQLYLAFKPCGRQNESLAKSCIERCLTDVKVWMTVNKLKMNDSKTEFIIIGSKQNLAKVEMDSIDVGEIRIHAVDSIRNLGAFFDRNLNMITHIAKKSKIAFNHLYNIRKIRHYLTKSATESLIHAFITSHLDYANSLLVGLPKCHTDRLQRILNSAARLVFQLPKYSHVTGLLRELHWLPMRARIEFKILLLTFKAIHGLAPKYLTDALSVQKPSRYSLRSSNTINLVTPMAKRKTMGDRAFAVAGPRLWNKLPAHIKSCTMVEQFKAKLKAHLFSSLCNY